MKRIARMRLPATGAATIAALAATAMPADAAESKSCRSYASVLRTVIKPRVEALRALEREAADRLLGLDTRTFEYLSAQTRAVSAVLNDPKGLADEESLKSCRGANVAPRRQCGDAAESLAKLVDAVAVEPREPPRDRDARQAYAPAMAACEALVGLKPLDTALRVTD